VLLFHPSFFPFFTQEGETCFLRRQIHPPRPKVLNSSRTSWEACPSVWFFLTLPSPPYPNSRFFFTLGAQLEPTRNTEQEAQGNSGPTSVYFEFTVSRPNTTFFPSPVPHPSDDEESTSSAFTTHRETRYFRPTREKRATRASLPFFVQDTLLAFFEGTCRRPRRFRGLKPPLPKKDSHISPLPPPVFFFVSYHCQIMCGLFSLLVWRASDFSASTSC